MQESAYFGRGRIVAAVLLSLALHGSLGVAWFTIRPSTTIGSTDAGTSVRSPDDVEMEITLREPSVAVAMPPAAVQPRKLPPTVEVPAVKGHGPSEIVVVGNPPKVPDPAIGRPSTKALHGQMKAGRMVAYALDCSSSMGSDGRLRTACDAVKASLHQLSPESRFQIVAYNGSAKAFANQPLLATDANRERASQWLDGLSAEGSSNHLAGLREALWQQPDAVFLLTDADDLDEKEAKAIRGILREGLLLNSVLIGSQAIAVESPLRRLCERTGGTISHR